MQRSVRTENNNDSYRQVGSNSTFKYGAEGIYTSVIQADGEEDDYNVVVANDSSS